MQEVAESVVRGSGLDVHLNLPEQEQREQEVEAEVQEVDEQNTLSYERVFVTNISPVMVLV